MDSSNSSRVSVVGYGIVDSCINVVYSVVLLCSRSSDVGYSVSIVLV